MASCIFSIIFIFHQHHVQWTTIETGLKTVYLEFLVLCQLWNWILNFGLLYHCSSRYGTHYISMDMHYISMDIRVCVHATSDHKMTFKKVFSAIFTFRQHRSIVHWNISLKFLSVTNCNSAKFKGAISSLTLILLNRYK